MAIANLPKLNFSVPFAMTAALPVEYNAYFSTLDDATAAAATAEAPGSSNTVYYFGQKIVVVGETECKLYIIQPNKTLKEAGGVPIGDGASITVGTDGKIAINGFATAEEGSQPIVAKDSNNKLYVKWQKPDTSTVTGLQNAVKKNTDDITALTGGLTTAEDDIDALEEWKTTASETITSNTTLAQSAKNVADKAVVANTAITAGIHTKITYDAKGLVTKGENLTASDIPDLDAAKITTGEFDLIRIPKIPADTKVSGLGDAAFKDVATVAIGTSATDDLVTGNQVKTYVETAVAGLSGAMHFKGKFDELPAATDYAAGDVVIVGQKEYVLLDDAGTKSWNLLGDEGSYAVKGSIVNADIATNAAIDQSKISGLVNDLAAKATPDDIDSKINTHLGNAHKTLTFSDGENQVIYNGTEMKSVTKETFGLGNVDNTADANKSVASAAKLTTARTIGISGAVTGTATSFDGSEDIIIATTEVDGTKVTGIVPWATKASQDRNGDEIHNTYATKQEMLDNDPLIVKFSGASTLTADKTFADVLTAAAQRLVIGKHDHAFYLIESYDVDTIIFKSPNSHCYTEGDPVTCISKEILWNKADNEIHVMTSQYDVPTTTILTTALAGKVDKDGSKGLSDENFTAAYKEKLEKLTESAINTVEESHFSIDEAKQLHLKAGSIASDDLVDTVKNDVIRGGKALTGIQMGPGGTEIAPMGNESLHTAVVTLPAATAATFGLVKISTENNKVNLDANGIMTVNNITTDKLVQGTDTLIWSGGSASSPNVEPTV